MNKLNRTRNRERQPRKQATGISQLGQRIS